MRKIACLGITVSLVTVATPMVAARAKKGDPQFYKKLSAQQKTVQALNRLTFGPRPGDVDKVRAMGLKKWIDLQLHPERIPESPVLEAKLRPLDTLQMPAGELVKHYPPPQLLRQMAAGRVPYPDDPQERQRLQRLVERFERR